MATDTIATELLQKQLETLRNENNYLKEQIEWFKRQVFGKRSEKSIELSNEDQLMIPGCEFVEKIQPKTQQISTHTRKKPERQGQDKITLPEDLPVERQVIDIPENEKICKETGLALIKIGEEITRKLAYRIGSHFIKEIVRPKYALPRANQGSILTAPLPESLLERCQADESFLADMLVKKFCDHLPLYRQSEMLSREGISISRQILCQWTLRTAKALKPLKDLLPDHGLDAFILTKQGSFIK